MSKLQACIFDLDGTLLYTLEDIAWSMNKALAELNLPPIETEEYRWIVGGGAEMIARNVLPATLHDEQHITAFVERFRSFYRNNWHEQTCPYDGITELVTYLREEGFQLAILSNKPQEFTEYIVSHFFNLHELVFDPVWGQREGIPTKPDPQSALQIARDWQLPAEQIAFLGDSDVDVWTAQRAGMLAVGCAWGFRGEKELRESGADIVLEHPQDFISYLQQHRGVKS